VLAYGAPLSATVGVIEPTEESPAVETTQYPVESDPTIVHAGLTEIDAPAATSVTNDTPQEAYDAHGIPQNSGFGDGAANATAEANWDNANDLSTSQEWVEIPRDTTETDTGITATPAAPSNVQSWADDQPDSPEVRNFLSFVYEYFVLVFSFCSALLRFEIALANYEAVQTISAPAINPNDGFHEVHRSRGGNRGDGQARGRGGRGGDGYRGRGGFRGDGRGRGRGPRGGARGGRRPDES
jgi:hypothetical protein